MNQLESLLTIQSLEHLPRIGWCQHGVASPESIAAHTHAVAQIALALCAEVSPTLDLGRVLSMAIVHDAPEALLGDLPRSASRLLPEGAKAAAEVQAAKELLTPASLAAFREYQAGETREARFVKLCDRLQLGLRTLAYRRAGQSGLEDFEDGVSDFDALEFAPAEALRIEIVNALEALA